MTHRQISKYQGVYVFCNSLLRMVVFLSISLLAITIITVFSHQFKTMLGLLYLEQVLSGVSINLDNYSGSFQIINLKMRLNKVKACFKVGVIAHETTQIVEVFNFLNLIDLIDIWDIIDDGGILNSDLDQLLIQAVCPIHFSLLDSWDIVPWNLIESDMRKLLLPDDVIDPNTSTDDTINLRKISWIITVLRLTFDWCHP